MIPPMTSGEVELRIEPSVIQFKGNENSVVFSIKNVSKRIKTVKLVRPVTKSFVLNGFMPSMKLAPGLEAAFEAVFTQTERGDIDYQDKIRVLTESDAYEIPLQCLAPSAHLDADKKVNFGVVVVETETEGQFYVHNKGDKTTDFSIDIDDSLPVTLTPKSGVIKAGQKLPITVHLSPSDVGVISAPLQITSIDSSSTDDKEHNSRKPKVLRVDIKAIVVNHRMDIVDVGTVTPITRTTGLAFSDTYYGDLVVKEVEIINDGPGEVSFNISCGSKKEVERLEAAFDHDDPSLAIEDSNLSTSESATAFHAYPASGVLEPYARKVLKCYFQPLKDEDTKGFTTTLRPVEEATQNFDHLMFVAFKGHNSSIKLPLSGKGLRPGLKLDPPILRFGSIPQQSYADNLLTLTNSNLDLPIKFSFPNVPYFHADQTEGIIAPSSSTSLVISYFPKALGVHNTVINVNIVSPTGRKLTTVSLKVSGSSLQLKKPEENDQIEAVVQGVKTVSDPDSSDNSPTNSPSKRPKQFVDPDTLLSPASRPKKTFMRSMIWEASSLDDPFGPLSPTQKKSKTSLILNMTSTGGTFSHTGKGSFYALSTEEQKQRHAHKAKYTSVLRRKRLEQERVIKQGGIGPEDMTDLGMDSHSGLKSPRLELPGNQVDPVWTQESNSTIVIPKNHVPIAPQDATLLQAFASTPQSTIDERDCCLEIPSSNISKLLAGPRLLDFGPIAPMTPTTRYFVFKNTLKSNILVSVHVDEHKETRTNTTTVPSSSHGKKGTSSDLTSTRSGHHHTQVVPKGHTAVFPVTVTVSSVQSYNRTVTYTLNDTHSFSFDIAADVVPVTLNLSTNALDFDFDESNWSNTVSRTMTMTNPNPFPAEFSWEMNSNESQNPSFSITPKHGSIPARGLIEANVNWTPNGTTSASKDASLTLRIIGTTTSGQPKQVKLTGHLPDSKMTTKESVLEIGGIPVGIPLQRFITLKNASQTSDSVFVLQPLSNNNRDSTMQLDLKAGLQGDVTVEPKRGIIAVGCSTEVAVNITPSQPGNFSETLSFSVRGAKNPVTVSVRYQASYPRVSVLQDELDLGSVYIGGASRTPLTIRNDSEVPAKLDLDLRRYPDFQLELPKGSWNENLYTDCPLVDLSCESDDDAQDASQARDSIQSQVDKCDEDDNSGCHYNLTVAPGSILENLQFVFRPRFVMSHAFELPLCLMGNHEEVEGKAVVGEGLRPRLLLSRNRVAFGSRVVLKGTQVKVPYALDLTLKNNDDKVLNWSFGQPNTTIQQESSSGEENSNSSQAQSTKPNSDSSKTGSTGSTLGVFEVEPSTGVALAPGSEKTVRITFTPKSGDQYQSIVPIYLDDDTTNAYVDLELSGKGEYPRLIFDTKELVLPQVPIGFTSTAMFHIMNKGYDNLELRYRLPADQDRIPVELYFPEGTLIGIAKEKLPVVVRFTAVQSMSFTAHLDFLDGDGRRYAFPISGTADNCLLTIQPFLKQKASNITWTYDTEEEGNGIVTVHPISNFALDNGNANGASNSNSNQNSNSNVSIQDAEDSMEGMLPLLGTTPSDPHSRHTISSFINASVNCTQIGDLVDDCIASKGKLAFEIVESLSGKSISGWRSAKWTSTKKDVGEHLLNHLEALLTFLKTHGALLNAVKPEYLLTKHDLENYLDIKKKRVKSTVEKDNMERIVRDVLPYHDVISTASWLALSFQAVKVFSLCRVTLKSLKSLPNMSGSSQDPKRTLGKSNVYSIPESILLKWMTACYRQKMPSTCTPVSNFDEDLKSGEVIFSLLITYWPYLERFHGCLHKISQEDASAPTPGGSPPDPSLNLPLYRENAIILQEMMETLPIRWIPSVDDLTCPDARTMLLFTLHLYQTLPQLIPCTTVSFNTPLGSKEQKTIELANPSNKPIAYTAAIEGHSDFSTLTTEIYMAPNSKSAVEVICSPTICKSISASLILASKTGDPALDIASTLVFSFNSEPATDLPLRTIDCENKLYELCTIDIKVTNPFPSDVDLTVKCTPVGSKTNTTTTNAPNQRTATAKSSRSTKSSLGRKQLQSKVPDERYFPNPFGCERSRMKLKQGATDTVTVFFLPFTLGQEHTHMHSCLLEFEDKDNGVFVYEVNGRVKLPNTSDVKKITCSMVQGPDIQHVIPFTFLNKPFEDGKKVFLEKHPLNKNREECLKLNTISTVPTASISKIASNANDNSSVSSPNPGQNKLGGDSVHCNEEVLYAVEKSSSYVSVPSCLPLRPVTANNNGNKTKEWGAAYNQGQGFDPNAEPSMSPSPQQQGSPAPPRVTTDDPNQLLMTLSPQGPGLYPVKIVLTSATDVRVVDVEFQVQAEPLVASLDFRCPARQHITQQVPLVNNSSDKTLSVRATLKGKGFIGPREMSVPPNSTQYYPLQFKAPWVGDYTGTLALFIQQTGETNNYTLKGTVMEPLAEGHIKIPCIARTNTSRTISVPNLLVGDAVYSVYSDMTCISGEETLTVASGSNGDYILDISAPKRGSIHGSITFAAASGHYLWYMIELDVAPPLEQDALDIEADVGKAVLVQIPVSNPTEDALEFQVTLEGDGLLGHESLMLEPHQKHHYSLYYAPDSETESLLPGSSSSSTNNIAELDTTTAEATESNSTNLHEPNISEDSGGDNNNNQTTEESGVAAIPVTSVRFENDVLGEFWYKLNLTAKPAS